MKKKFFICLLSLLMVFTMMPAMAMANESDAGRTIDFATFLEEVEEADYDYDGKGVTVEWRSSSACTDNRHDHSCLLEGEDKKPDGNNPQRGQAPNAQYQVFNEQTDVRITNVNFKFNPADFTLCMNSDWKGEFSAENIKNAELQMLNTGNVSFSGCDFDGVIVSPFGSKGESAFTECDFKNVYDAYAIKDIYSPNASITGCTFDNCGGGIYFEGNTDKESIVIENNVFTNIDTNAAEGKQFTRGLIQFSANGDYSNADITITGNSSTGEAAVIRQLNTTITSDVLDFGEVETDRWPDWGWPETPGHPAPAECGPGLWWRCNTSGVRPRHAETHRLPGWFCSESKPHFHTQWRSGIHPPGGYRHIDLWEIDT